MISRRHFHRSHLSFILLLAVILCILTLTRAAAQDSTDPIGFYVLNAKQGLNLLAPGLVGPTEFSGKVTTVTPGPVDSNITVLQAGWAPGEFTPTGPFPTHYVEIVEAGHTALGLMVDIVQNGSDDLTLAITDSELAAYGITGNEQIRVRAHITIKAFFENTTLAAFSDEVKLFRPGATFRYIHNGSTWMDSATFNSADGQVIYPGEGFSFRTSAPNKNIVVGGDTIAHVKTTPTLVNVYGGQFNLIGQVNPLVGASGFFGDIDFSNALTAAFADSVTLYSNPGSGLEVSGRYIFNGAELVSVTDFQPVADHPLSFAYALSVRTRDDVALLLPPGF